jgi:hypothetical protein
MAKSLACLAYSARELFIIFMGKKDSRSDHGKRDSQIDSVVKSFNWSLNSTQDAWDD